MKEKYQLEYIINSSPKVLYSRLATAGGLSEWFADDVDIRGNIFTFIWEGNGQKAEMINKKDGKHVRFHWLDDEDDKTYFEFKINIDDLTNDVALVVTDFAEPDEIEDSTELWNSQIQGLKHILGL